MSAVRQIRFKRISSNFYQKLLKKIYYRRLEKGTLKLRISKFMTRREDIILLPG